MKTKHSMTIYFVIAFTFLMLAIGTAAAELGTETRITTDVSSQSGHAIYGDRIVWTDDRNGNGDIYMYDISTGVETQITTDGGQRYPAIYGDRIVWEDYRNGKDDIYMYDISTGVETQITTDGGQWDPAIYGDRIVWYDFRNGNSDIYMYDISTGTETRITTDVSVQYDPAIYGDRIVWQDSRNGNSDIYMYDISTGVETQITTDGSDQWNSDIYGDRIVWMDNRNGNSDIYMYDISTGVETQITTDVSSHYNPAIYGDRIVWEDYRDRNGDIYMYDISTGVETQITTDGGQWDPAIYGDRIVWEDYRNGNSDIYMFTLDSSVDNPPVANAGTDKNGTINVPISFDGSASTDDKGIVSYSWDFNIADGITTQATGPTPKYTYKTAGTRTVGLTVTDAAGQKSNDTLQVIVSAVTTPTSTVSYTPTHDNRLRDVSPTTVLSTSTYIDIGRSTSSYRDLMLFDLSSYKTTDTISKATLSLYWYYPAGATRTSDTIVEIYRPLDWDPKYVTWNSRLSGTSWTTAGGNWFDKNGVSQGATPYASLTFAGSKMPDNRYYDFDVTQLVQEYVSGKYPNTGFFVKAKSESGNYIAFYSSEWSNAAQRPKLFVTSTSGSTTTENPPVANAGADKTATVGSAVTFDASASTDDKGIASYSWDFDASNGITSEASTVSATKTYAAVGTYTVTLTVTDTIGQKSTDTLQVVVSAVTTPTSTVSYAPVYDNRLREASATTVLSTTNYIDVGSTTANFRDVMLFDLSSYKTTDTISKATLSLYWYYPAGKTRTSDTIVEIYRPLDWDPQYVTWNARLSGTLWSTAGGNWFDKNNVAQGATPYASLTFAGSKVPDNRYYEFDVTQLVQEYVSGKYKNTGFFLKAKTESGNYIAFYSNDWSNAAQRPKLFVTSTSGSTTTDSAPVANAGADKTATTNSAVTFDGSASTDDKGITSYSWDFDASNGITSEATGVMTAKAYTTAGIYTVTLTVTDTAGQKSTDTLQVTVSNLVSSVSYAPLYDNRLRSETPTSVLSTTNYLDIGRSSASARDVMMFDLNSYKTTDTISKATLSLYWYFPAGKTRTSDTVVEVYRPLDWDPRYVTWNSRLSGTLWSAAGGNWFDKNAVAQGTTPYASLTFAGSKVPDNKYYDFDVTQLVQEYISGKYKNTGFFLKAKTESGNYIAFYSSEYSNAAMRPKLTITS